MRFTRHFLGLCLLLFALSSCTPRDGFFGEPGGEPVPLQLSFALQGSSGLTKADADSFTELADEGHFRGMEDIRILPFAANEITSASQAIGDARVLPSISGSIDDRAFTGASYHQGLIRNNHSHLYPDAYAALPQGTRSVLVYGKAPRVNLSKNINDKHFNGSLIEDGWETDGSYISASGLRYSPEPIYEGDGDNTATQIARILTDLVSAVSYTQIYYYRRSGIWHTASVAVAWNDNVGDPILRDYFRWITGDSQLMTGAGSNLEYMLTSLYRRLCNFHSLEEDPYLHTVGGVQYTAVLTEGGDDGFTYAHLYDGLRDVLLARFDDLLEAGDIRIDSEGAVSFSSGTLKDYPRSLGLPAGAASLRWRGLNFAPAAEGLDGIAPIDRFCYMPSLYYYASTTLSTSEDREIYKKYTKDMQSWSSILSQYRLGKVVNTSTRSVALDEPLQYACGMLVATVRATSTSLPDNDGDDRTACSATGTNFPVTGIILGGQFRQNFDFSPDLSGNEYNLYDRNISGVYLTTAESADMRTLVLPTPANRDIYFYLELRNDSGTAFTGAEGIILPGQYFYLAGKLEKSTDASFPSVFMQDHLTTAHCTVSSMENAHICVPEMGNPQLMLGVQTRTNWTMAASSYVILD